MVELFVLGGLTVEARCDAGPVLVVSAQTAADNSELISDFAGSASGGIPDFDVGEVAFLADSPVVSQLAQGRAVYAGSDGRAVVIEAIAVQHVDGVGGTTNDCGFTGLARAG